MPSVVVSTKKLTIPAWLVFLMIFFGVAIVATAIVLPLVLLKKSSPVLPTATITQPLVPSIPTINPEAILFQNALPAIDGLAKGVIQIQQQFGTLFGYMLVGSSSKSGYYVTNTVGGTTANPTIIQGSSAISYWANSYLNEILYAQKFPVTDPPFFACQSDIISQDVTCNSITFPSASSIDLNLFNYTRWINISNNSVFSFQASQGLAQITGQDPTAVYTGIFQTTTTPFPSDVNIITSFISSVEDSNTFGYADRLNNDVFYMTNSNATASQPIQSLSIDSDESLLFCDMTPDGLWLLVLTDQRLSFYGRSQANSTFSVLDRINLPTSVDPAICNLDHAFGYLRFPSASDATSIWCIIGTSNLESIIVPFDTSSKTFTEGMIRSLPSKTLVNTAGPIAIQVTPDQLFLFIVQTDLSGNYENVYIKISDI